MFSLIIIFMKKLILFNINIFCRILEVNSELLYPVIFTMYSNIIDIFILILFLSILEILLYLIFGLKLDKKVRFLLKEIIHKLCLG